MPAFLARLAEVCSEHRLREKILVVPSLAIGHQIADAVAHGGTPWVNLRVETIRTLSDAIAGFALAKEGLTVLSRAQALALIERSCDRALGAGSYFAALADRPGLHRAIQRSIDDLRHAAVDPARIATPAFEDRRKAADIVRILATYNEELRERRYIDRFGVLTRAISMLERGAARPWSRDAIWIAADDMDLTAAEERFLELVAGKSILKPPAEEEGVQSPASVEFRSADGEENELRGAFRAILDAETPFDSAEIVYTTRETYLPLAYELAAEYEIPCTFAEGIAAHFTRPGMAALAFLRWIGNGWHAADLQRAARAGAFATPGFARVMRRARIGWERDRYLRGIDLLLANAETTDRMREAAGHAREIVLDLLKITKPIAGGETMDVPAAARAASAFVARLAHVRNEVDAMAREGLRRMLDELSVLGAQDLPRREAAARLAEAVSNLHVAASNPRPGFLHVAPVRAGGWSARSRMDVVGLDESKHPGRGLQDPVILDVEREAIGIPIAGDRPRKSSEQFRRLLARAAGRRITLSYASLKVADRREQFPSSSLLETFRAAKQNPNATYVDVAAGTMRQGFVAPVALSGSEWWLSRRFAGGSADPAPVYDAYPGLAAGARAVEARESGAITKWDGLISASEEELDPRRNGRVYSATQIENMAGCPFGHFLERILHVRPLEEITYEPDTWLQPNEFGSLVHEVLQSAMDELCAAGKKPSLEFLPRMQAVAAGALERYRERIPPPSMAAYEKRRKELRDMCEIFLRTEEEACRTVVPKHFEVSFGAGEDDGLAMAEPFALPLGAGRSVQLRGRIDRIDHDESAGEWHVWDYKSGSTWAYDRGGVLACGTKIQHAIYARAAAEMLKRKGLTPRVTRSGYLFPTSRGGGARLPRECSDKELNDALNALFDVVATGYFPHGGAEACKFCDFKAVCGGAEIAAQRATKKLFENPGHPAVRAWRELQEIK